MSADSLPTICRSCVHLEPTQNAELDVSIEHCAAYPFAIPEDIRAGADHRQPRGDERDGIVHRLEPTDYASVMLTAYERYVATRAAARA